MEYKLCENCNEKLHVRTQKCPFCNTILTEKSKIIKEEEPVVTKEDIKLENENQENMIDQTPNIEKEIENTNLPNKDVRDYIYKAEVRHTLEYTKLLSNGVKVFLTALAMFPVIGQIIGTFFGVFFLTYDDTDRKSFGGALITLSIIMFAIYVYQFMAIGQLMQSGEFNSLLEQLK